MERRTAPFQPFQFQGRNQRQNMASASRGTGKRKAPTDHFRGSAAATKYSRGLHSQPPPPRYPKRQRTNDPSWRAFYLEILRTLQCSISQWTTKAWDTNLFQQYLERTKNWEQNDPLTDSNFDVWDLYSKTMLEKFELPNILKSNCVKALKNCRDFLNKVEAGRTKSDDPKMSNHPCWLPVPHSPRLLFQHSHTVTFRVCEKLRGMLVNDICAVKNRELFTSWQIQQLPYLHAVCKCLAFLEGTDAKRVVEHNFTETQQSKFQTLLRSGQVAVRLACQDGAGATKILSAINQFAGRISKDCFQVQTVESARGEEKNQIAHNNPVNSISGGKTSFDSGETIPSRENKSSNVQRQSPLRHGAVATGRAIGNASPENAPLEYNSHSTNLHCKRTGMEREIGVTSVADGRDDPSWPDEQESRKRKTLEPVFVARARDAATIDSKKRLLALEINPYMEMKTTKSPNLAVFTKNIATLLRMHLPENRHTGACSVAATKKILDCLIGWKDTNLIDSDFGVYDVYTKVMLEKVHLPDVIKSKNSRAVQDCKSFLSMVESERKWFEQPNNNLQHCLPLIPVGNSSVHRLDPKWAILVSQKLRALLDEICDEKMFPLFSECTVLKLPYLDAVSLCLKFLNGKPGRTTWKEGSTMAPRNEMGALLRCGRIALNLAYLDGSQSIKTLRRVKNGLPISPAVPIEASETRHNDPEIIKCTATSAAVDLNYAGLSTISGTVIAVPHAPPATDSASLSDSGSPMEKKMVGKTTDDLYTHHSPRAPSLRMTPGCQGGPPNHDRGDEPPPARTSPTSPVFVSLDLVHAPSPRCTNQQDVGTDISPEQRLAKYQLLLNRMELLRQKQEGEVSHLSEQIETLEGYLNASTSLYNKQRTKLKDLSSREECLRKMVRDNTERTHFLQRVLKSGKISEV
uniref:Uncharacterized protein n=1 Tax=Amphora coffeiformis TaxID=265554 RepID=A0A6S8IJQ3_9STRA